MRIIAKIGRPHSHDPHNSLMLFIRSELKCEFWKIPIGENAHL
jgi:hypothetical protein